MTSLKDEVGLQRARWKELDTLISTAKSFKPESTEYSSVCRSLTVLICSHFEGAIKGISKAILLDINENLGFKSFPDKIKNKYIRITFLNYAVLDKNEKQKTRSIEISDDRAITHIASMVCRGEHNVEIDKLLTMFDHCSSFEMKDLSEWAKFFGVKDFSRKLNNSILTDAFSDREVAFDLLKKIERRCLDGSSYYPYRFKDISRYELDKSDADNTQVFDDDEGLFSDFLFEMFQSRHKIAHGDDLGYSHGVNELELDIAKMRILLYGYLLLIGNAIYEL